MSNLNKAKQLIMDLGGFQNIKEVENIKFNQPNFLENVQLFIESKKYKQLLSTLKSEYSFLNTNSGGEISEDEKIIRRSLRGMGFNEDSFFNPSFEKNNLVSYVNRSGDEKIYKVESVFKDSGAYYYNLRDLDNGIQVGGRLPQSEIKEPTFLQYVEHYKKTGSLDIYLFNKFNSLKDSFDASKVTVEKNDFSFTQGSHTIKYDNKEMVRLDAGKTQENNWKGVSLEERIKTAKKFYEDGNEPFSNHEPFYLDEKFDFINALSINEKNKKYLSFMSDSNKQIGELVLNGTISKKEIYNTLVMIGDTSILLNNPFSVKYPKEVVADDEINQVMKLALKHTRLLHEYGKVANEFFSLKDELKQIAQNQNSGRLNNLLNASAFSIGFNTLNTKEIGNLLGESYMYLKKDYPDVHNKIWDFHINALEFIKEREKYKINRPDLNNLLSESSLSLSTRFDTKKDDKIVFESLGRNPQFEHETIVDSFNSLIDGATFEISLANNGYRRELYQTFSEGNGGCNLSYCEGDLVLNVFKNKEAFIENLNSCIEFYGEENGLSSEQIESYKKEIFEKNNLLEDNKVQEESTKKVRKNR